MTAESKRSVVFLLVEIVNGGDLRALDGACASSLSWHANGVVDRRGQAALRAQLQPLLVAFPDLTMSVDDLLVDGNRVACRFRWRGTHLGVYGDVAPSGRPATGDRRPATGSGLAIFRVTAGRIVEAW